MKQIHHFINGKQHQGSSGNFDNVYNPTTGEVSAEVAMANEADTQSAITAAHEKFPEWRAMTPLKRARIFFKYKELIEKKRR